MTLLQLARAKLLEVQRELRAVRAEFASYTPQQQNVPLSAQQPGRQMRQCCWQVPVLMLARLLFCQCFARWASLPICKGFNLQLVGMVHLQLPLR